MGLMPLYQDLKMGYPTKFLVIKNPLFIIPYLKKASHKDIFQLFGLPLCLVCDFHSSLSFRQGEKVPPAQTLILHIKSSYQSPIQSHLTFKTTLIFMGQMFGEHIVAIPFSLAKKGSISTNILNQSFWQRLFDQFNS